MPEPAARRWTVQEFFAWQERQETRYELVGGVPGRPMAGARNVHDDIVVNLLAEFRIRLRGGPCRPFTGDGSIETLPGQIRRPDLGVGCGARDPDGTTAAEPRLVVEVLSPSTRDFDTFDKLGEYKTVASLAQILLVEPNAPEIAVWSRGADGAWARRLVAGLEQTVDLPELGRVLALRDVYDGVAFPPRPRLVPGPDA
ncbi:MAG: Uma2 family endonuclease [Methylobacterium sp.]|uniref:Uma2 family endonuclease n=1 Tax=Methylobacterium sp. TaxID=409 RepID=UPI002586395B|nr:Uma2 family endonuclease [Methylobacterium sp.]MBY0299576.1 Uma2 family endonuclease [Methylobacterium sp.]